MSRAVILFAHGARDPEWANPLRRVQAAMRAQSPEAVVELAFLEFMTPSLADCAATLVANGADRIVVLPMFIAQGGHLKRDVPNMLAQLRNDWPHVQFALAPAIGENDRVIQAMAAAALEEAGSGIA